MGLRLNKRPPNIYFKKKKEGGIKFNATVPLTKVSGGKWILITRALQLI